MENLVLLSRNRNTITQPIQLLLLFDYTNSNGSRCTSIKLTRERALEKCQLMYGVAIWDVAVHKLQKKI